MGNPLAKKHKRSIEFAQFNNELGLISAEELVSARSELWREWRSRITDNRMDGDIGYQANCLLCKGRVHIYVARSHRAKTELPAFRHAKGQGEDCPWHTGDALTPEHVRMLQYLGQQESQLHRELCQEIHGLLLPDPRVTNANCNKRYTSAEGDRWKIPDVSADIEGFGKIALELQLSNTFQTEVSGRARFYNKEGIGLIWIFHKFDPSLNSIPTSFLDVIHRQKGNAFVLDLDAKLASVEENTLCLKCYLQKKVGFEEGKIVRIDQLKIPQRDCMYLEDRLVQPIIDENQAYRQKWRRMLRQQDSPYDAVEVLKGNDLKNDISNSSDLGVAVKFISVILSVLANAAKQNVLYATKQPNLVAMLNTYLNTKNLSGLARYATLIEELLNATKHDLPKNCSVYDHIRRAKESEKSFALLERQVKITDPNGDILKRLVPEIFDRHQRTFLKEYEALPLWVRPEVANKV
jgi:hypothetical protein